MQNNSLPVIAITVHSSDSRPKGYDYLNNLLNSIKRIEKFVKGVVIVDNQSSMPIIDCEFFNDFCKSTNTDVILKRIDNQLVSGLTGAWNVAIKEGFKMDTDIVINANDDLVFNDTLKNYIEWYRSVINTPFICGPITDDEGTGDRLRKLSNTKFAKESNLPIKDVSNFKNPLYEEKARNKWLASQDWVIDAIDSKDKPWLNGFCFSLNRVAYEKIMQLNDNEYFFPIGQCIDNNVDKNGVKKSRWGGQEYSFCSWQKLLNIEMKIIGNWYVEHSKDENKLWRVHQSREKN